MSLDAEAMVATFLRSALGVSVYTDLPHTRTYPLVVASRNGGPESGGFGLSKVNFRLQVWAEDKGAAHDLAQDAIRAAAAMSGPIGDFGCAAGWVTSSLIYDPDTEAQDSQGHARPRYVIDAELTCHP